MKYILFTAVAFVICSNVNAQTPPSVSGSTGTNNASYWSRSGNNAQSGANIFGTRWNSPIYFITGGLTQDTYRMKLNGDFGPVGAIQYPINFFDDLDGVNTSGYLGLGHNLNGFWSDNINPGSARGPFSLLHLNGRDGNFVQDGGYRPWMKTGITFTDNQDMSYFGLRTILPDLTETVLSWSEVQSNIVPPGQDDMVFRMTAGGGTSPDAGQIGNFQSTTDLDGLHVARFTGFGHFALGNTFGTTQGGSPYVRPESHFHMSHHAYSASDRQWGFMQITYRDLTGETANDGLRFGIDRVAASTHGFLRWQENSAFIFQTDWDNNAGGIENGERLRITSIAENGVVDPLNPVSQNISRVAISHVGSSPITSPRSLLHLGYNTGINALPGSADGWRNWMDIGTFTSNGTDNMYSGLKAEGADRYDAVINWGDNQVAGADPNGSDYLRFIFTSTTTALTGQGDPISQSQDGLEVTRMDPKQASTLTNNYGMVGIGNFATNGPNTAAGDVIDAKLDIDGDLRIREVTQDNSLTQVLVIDPNDHNRVHYADINIPTGGNGFIVCSDTSNASNLTANSKINLNNNNLFFENNDVLGTNHTGFGYNCGSVLPAKVSVFQDHTAPVAVRTEAISGINNDITNALLNEQVGVYGQSTQTQNPSIRPINIAGDFAAGNAELNIGVRAIVTSPAQSTSETNLGVYAVVNDENAVSNVGGSFQGGGNANNTGVWGNAIGDLTSGNGLSYGVIGHGRFSLLQNVGVIGRTESIFAGTTGNINSPYGAQQNFGVAGYAGGANLNVGVYGEASTATGSTNYAGYFTGSTVTLGSILIASDSTLKENIVPISETTDSLFMLIETRQYEFTDSGNAARMSLPDGVRYGVLAQQVEPLFPELVRTVQHPAEVDTSGNIVNPSFEFKAVDLEQMIPLLIQNLQKQSLKASTLETQLVQEQAELDSKDSLINDLNNRLSQLENCLSGILPFLCQLSNTAIEQNDTDLQNELIRTIQVELSNKDNIVLNQNVPNPFAESTVITFSIPETVQRAQIHFYDGTGKLINSVEIEERGAGRLNVFGSDLSSGVYTYSLVADGQVVSTKRMVKQ